MMKVKQLPGQARRDFLKGVVAAGGSAVLMTSITQTAQAEHGDADTLDSSADSRGYQETPHVRAYYASARS
jgi:hypothetical protein